MDRAGPAVGTGSCSVISGMSWPVGLRERLLMEIERFGAADRGRARDALALACRLHAADRQRREPYANHYADRGIIPTWRRELLVAAA